MTPSACNMWRCGRGGVRGISQQPNYERGLPEKPQDNNCNDLHPVQGEKEDVWRQNRYRNWRLVPFLPVLTCKQSERFRRGLAPYSKVREDQILKQWQNDTERENRKVIESCFDEVIGQLLNELQRTLTEFPNIKVRCNSLILKNFETVGLRHTS